MTINSIKNSFKNPSWRLWLTMFGLGLIFLSIWLPRVMALDQFVTPDEHLWLSRSGNFYYALGQRDFASTYQKEHPGVTTMWAGMAGYLVRFPEYRGSGLGQVNSPQLDYYLRKIAQIPPLEILEAGRFFMVLGNTFVLALAFLYALKLVGPLPALIGFLLIAFDPFHVALTRLLHLDGSLSNLLLLTLLSFIYYLRKRHWRDLIISGAAASLSWLTKSPGFFIIPIIGILILVDLLENLRAQKNTPFKQQLWRYIWPVLIWVVTAILVFILLWPAMWVEPIETLSSVFGQAQKYAETGHHSPLFFNGTILEDGRIGGSFFYFYPLNYLWRTTPIVIIGLLAAVWAVIKKRKPFNEKGIWLTLFGLLILVIVFTVVMTTGSKKFDRYLLPVFAPLDLIAGLGWVAIIGWLNDQRFVPLKKFSLPIIVLAVIGIQMLVSLRTFPYYLTYYNPLMGGSRKALEVMQIGWGEGIDQAARYLNEKKNAEDLHVKSWYNLGSFSYFFKGHVGYMGSQQELSEDRWERFVNSDYAVIYVHQWQRNTPRQILEYLSQQTPEKSIWLNGIEYARIYKLR